MTLLALSALFVAALLWREHAMQRERREWTRERGGLLNRIKPETAQHVPDGPEPETFQSPALDDDEAWRKLREQVTS